MLQKNWTVFADGVGVGVVDSQCRFGLCRVFGDKERVVLPRVVGLGKRRSESVAADGASDVSERGVVDVRFVSVSTVRSSGSEETVLLRLSLGVRRCG